MVNKYTMNELVAIGCRENNSIRPYLYVNPIQGKHIPVEPEKPLQLFHYIADIIDRKYCEERILLIAFAETATAVGCGIAYYSSSVKYCTQTTREKYEDAMYLNFTEDHSHATNQTLIINGYDQVIKNVDRILFVDDEVTTGNTICHLMKKIKMTFPDFKGKFSIVSILNSMTDERIDQMKNYYLTECLYVCRVPYKYGLRGISDFACQSGKDNILVTSKDNDIMEYKQEDDLLKTEMVCVNSCNFRFLHEQTDLLNDAENYIENVLAKINVQKIAHNILVLGTEEFMFLPLKVADAIHHRFPKKNVMFHATTRSPIKTSDAEAYPLHSRCEMISLYDSERITYIYNLEKYDLVILLTDANITLNNACERLKEVLRQTGCKDFYLICRK